MNMNTHWLYKCQDDLSYLEALLTCSFGPIGRHALLVTDSKQILCSSRGIDILDTWKPKHPVVALAVKVALAFGKQQGGGTKRLLLMVLAGLRTAHKITLDSNAMYNLPSIAGLCHAFEAVKDWQMELAGQVANDLHISLCTAIQQQMSPQQSMALVPEAVTDMAQHQQPVRDSKLNALNDMEGCQRRLLRAVIHTHLTNRVSRHVVRKILSPLITDLLMATVRHSLTGRSQTEDPDATCQTAAWQEALHKLSSHPPIHILPGQPVESSKLICGILLISSLLDRNMPQVFQGISCIVVTCSLFIKPQSAIDVNPMQLLISSADQYRDAMLYNEQLLHTLMQKLSSCGVTLIVCTEPCPEPCANICTLYGISVISLVEKDAALSVATATNTCPITSLTALLRLDNNKLTSDHVSHVHEVRQVAVAGLLAGHQRGVLLHIPDAPPFLQLAGPNEGICRQYRHLVIDCLKLLNSAFHDDSQGMASSFPVNHCKAASSHNSSSDMGLQGEQQGVILDDQQIHMPRTQPVLAQANDGVKAAKVLQDNRATDTSDILPHLRLIPGGCAWSARLASLLKQHMKVLKHGMILRNYKPSSAAEHQGELQLDHNSIDSSNIVQDDGRTLLHTNNISWGCNTVMHEAGGHMYINPGGTLPVSSLLPAYQILHAMAAAVPSTIVQGYIDANGPSFTTGKAPGRQTALQLLDQMFTQPGMSRPLREAREISFIPNGLVCPSQSFNKHGRFLSSDGKEMHRQLDSSARTDQDMFIVTGPGSYGVLEPAHHVLGIWNAASTLLMQLLRVDMVVSSKPHRMQTSLLTDVITRRNSFESSSDTEDSDDG